MIIKEEAPFPINNPYKSNNTEQIDKIQSKIKEEIETAEKYAEELLGKLLNLHTYPDESCDGDYREFKGKVQFGKDLQQWIKDNIEEG